MGKKFLTEEEQKRILELRNGSASLKKICNEIHRGRKTITDFLKNPEEYVKQMESYEKLPLSMSTPRKKSVKPKEIKPATTPKKFLTVAEREKIDHFLSEGRSLNFIGLQLGRGTATIRTYLDDRDGYEELINKSILEYQDQLKNRLPPILTVKDRELILKLKASGWKTAKIAKRLRKNIDSIILFTRHKHNYEEYMHNLRNGTLKKKNKPNSVKIKDEDDPLNLSNMATTPDGSRFGFKKFLTAEERSRILELRSQNSSMKKIALLTRRGAQTIRDFLADPDKYTEQAEQYQKLKADRKKQRKKGKTHKFGNITESYKLINSALTEDAHKNFNKISLEHRAVIKYLVKKGLNAESILEDFKDVYGKSIPTLDLINYWVEQFEQGRETIITEPRSGIRPNGLTIDVKDQKKKHSVGGGSSNGSSSGGENVKVRPPVKLKLFEIKFKPLKRLQDKTVEIKNENTY